MLIALVLVLIQNTLGLPNQLCAIETLLSCFVEAKVWQNIIVCKYLVTKSSYLCCKTYNFNAQYVVQHKFCVTKNDFNAIYGNRALHFEREE